ncbi:cyclin J isoform X2 [Rhodnius prolixus]|uniref:cyclin J isoform X2 n=1 Tax=Rhodnius prolixus TaxID=13249 RepID=UPI003D18DCF7
MREVCMDEWYLTCYAFDINKNLKERELFGRKIQFQSPQLKYRTKLLDWLKSVAERLTLSNVTVHLGIFLIDKFMDNHNIVINRLASVALVCLLIAAKFEELDSRIPKLTDLPALVGYEMSLAEFVQLEIFVLNSFNWRISWPTPAHFAEFYSLCAVNAGDRDYNCTPHHHLSDLITSSLRDFLDVTLSDVTLLEYRSSEVAAACLLAARVEHGLRPLWPEMLETITGYTILQLQPVFNVIIDADISHGRKRKFDETHESGYESSSPECSKHKAKLLKEL